MNIVDAQKDMRHAYYGGGPGIVISGLIWLISGIAAYYLSAQTTIIIFFFGGMLIHPLGIVACKLFKRSGNHAKDNPLGKLAMESTILLFVGLFLAYTIFQIQPNWFFPIMLLIIGARYVIFQSVYGLKLFWILGGILMGAGFVLMTMSKSFQIPALVGGAIEIIFGLGSILTERNSKRQRI